MGHQIKPATTFEQQIRLLQSRGLVIPDIDFALSVMKRLNYYRFTAYTLTFKKDDVFFPGTTFEVIYRHYEFDTKLRSLLIEIVEFVEISFRTHIAYFLAHKYGPIGYLDSSVITIREHGEFIKKLDKLLKESKDLFVIHHRDKYSGVYPIWVAIEVLMFSDLSKLFKNLNNSDKKQIASNYKGLHFNEISNWLHMLTLVRNKSAHYARLFNQKLPLQTRFMEKDAGLEIEKNQLFAIIFNSKYLIDRSIWNSWVTRLEALLSEYDEVDIKLMGFKEEWKSLLLK